MPELAKHRPTNCFPSSSTVKLGASGSGQAPGETNPFPQIQFSIAKEEQEHIDSNNGDKKDIHFNLDKMQQKQINEVLGAFTLAVYYDVAIPVRQFLKTELIEKEKVNKAFVAWKLNPYHDSDVQSMPGAEDPKFCALDKVLEGLEEDLVVAVKAARVKTDRALVHATRLAIWCRRASHCALPTTTRGAHPCRERARTDGAICARSASAPSSSTCRVSTEWPLSFPARPAVT